MTLFEISLKPSLKTSRKLAAIVIALAGTGVLDAGYLTMRFYSGTPPPCTISGCEAVLTSSYAAVAGVPIAFAGALFYGSIILLSSASLITRHPAFLIAACALTPIGFLASLYLLLIQMFVLHSYCMYCLASALISTLLFITAVFAIHRRAWYTVRET